MASGVENRVTRSRVRTIVAAIVLGLGFLSFTAYLMVQEIASLPGRALESGRDALVELASAFRQGSIETRFSSYTAEISGSQFLQFATLNETEIFQRTDSTSVFWGALSLPDVVVEATAPVVYTYYVDLGGSWAFSLDRNVVRVRAPEIRFNEPAIDASGIEYRVREDSLIRNSDEAIENLRALISELTRQRAADNIELVREVGRRRIEDFVRTWMGSEFGNSEQIRIVVDFADEDSRPPLREREVESP